MQALPPDARRIGGRGASIARVYAATAGKAALARLTPLGCGVLIFSAIVFGPTGMRPSDVVRALASSASMRAGLWAIWLVLAASPARSLFDTPSAWLLRWLPIRRTTHAALAAAGLAILATPWVVLFGVGGGALTGLAAGLAASALELAWVARPSKAAEVVATLAVIACIVTGAPAIVLAAVATAAAWPLFAGAFARAPERGGGGLRAIVDGAPAPALALAIGASVTRGERAVLGRGLLFAIIGGLYGGLTLRNGDARDAAGAAEIALVAGALPLAVAAAGVTHAGIAVERRIGWLLDATATSARVRVAARLSVSAAIVSFDALVAGGVCGAIAPVSAAARVIVVAALVAWGAAIGVAVAALARGAERRDGVDGTSVLVRALGAAAATASLASAGGARALPLVACGAAALAALDVRRAANPGRA